MRLYDPAQHTTLIFDYGQDPNMLCLAYDALALWLLGFPDQSLARSYESIALAQQLQHPSSHSLALHFAARLHQFRREGPQTQERADAAITLVTAHQLSRQSLAMATIFRGWALTQQAHEQEGVAQIQWGLAAYGNTGANLFRSYGLSLLAQALSKHGQVDEGLKVLNEGVAAVQEDGVRWWEAEIHRLIGESLLFQSMDNHAEAASCFQTALNVARSQQAKSLELRAATSLARLWQRQGKRDEARELLEPIYHWFTEGFDTADLQGARTLLDALQT
jgi:predicted ATPase